MKNRIRFSGLFIAVMLWGQCVHAAGRLALVIGNSEYEEINPLANPANDAEDVAAKLQALGFELYGGKVHHNLDERALLRQTAGFAEAAEGLEIAFLYFAGHGMQFNGDPHLLPVDIPDDRLSIVRREAVGLNGLLATLAGRAELTIAVFDACREIPDYKEKIKRAVRGGSDADWRGLSRPKVQADSTLVAYSGGSGELVADGTGRNSPYTQLLLSHLNKQKIQSARLDVPGLFAEVSYQFRLKHRGQRPEVINQGVRPNQYYLASLPLPDTNPGNNSPAPDDRELELWRSIDRANTVEEYELFIANYPDSVFSAVARSRIARITRSVPTDTTHSTEIPNPSPEPSRTPAQPAAATTGRLTVKVTPSDARVRIMNIVPKYRDKIELEINREYDVLVDKAGYQPWRQQVLLTGESQVVAVTLQKRSVPVKPALKSYEPEMVLVKGGCYQMGSPASEKGRDSDERLHRVCVEDMYAGKYEVTFAQYDVFAKRIGKPLPDDQGWGRGNRPVINVSWEDATAYAKWLSEQTGKSYRLPTEAEWEYAARSGTGTAYWWGHDVGNNRAKCRGCGSRWDDTQAAPVGSFAANTFGLHDTVGNVWEWTCSGYDKDYGGAESQCGRVQGARRVLRGGSWSNYPSWSRSAYRFRSYPVYRSYNLGFRIFQGVR